MIRSNLKILVITYLLLAGLYFTSCKSKSKDTGNSLDTTSMTTPAPVPPAPVEVNSDDALTTGVKDATKDYPGVKADVNNGEITLTGEIKRSKLPDLMMSLNSLKPKKINNQLTVK